MGFVQMHWEIMKLSFLRFVSWQMKYPPSTRTWTKYEILPNGVGTLNLERFHGHSNAQFMCIRRNLERPRCELMEAGETTRNPYSYRIICIITPSVNITTASRHDEILYCIAGFIRKLILIHLRENLYQLCFTEWSTPSFVSTNKKSKGKTWK